MEDYTEEQLLKMGELLETPSNVSIGLSTDSKTTPIEKRELVRECGLCGHHFIIELIDGKIPEKFFFHVFGWKTDNCGKKKTLEYWECATCTPKGERRIGIHGEIYRKGLIRSGNEDEDSIPAR